MKITITLIAGALLASSAAKASPNDCTDYISRHQKQDFQAVKLRFQHFERMGDINFPHQRIYLTLKNTGEVGFPSAANGLKPIKVKVNGHSADAQVSMPAGSGATKLVRINLPPGTLKHCEKSRVQIDLTHSVGQWGCNVWNNDSAILKALDVDNNKGCFTAGHAKPKYPLKPIE